jgi:3-hydroxyacyl-[acyl-carrier-protein] dehydratase
VDPREILPHRRPFLFLDDIEELTVERARARTLYRPDEPYFAGHFPGEPVVPGVIQLETMGQLVVALGLHNARVEGVRVEGVFLSIVTDCMFYRVLRPADEVVVTAERLWMRMKTIHAKGELHHTVTGDLVAEATIRGSGQRVGG